MARGGQNNNANHNQFQPISPSPSISTEVYSVENSGNPYFLHSEDHPSLALVSHLLTRSNYSTWSHAMWMALNAKNKLGFIDRSIPQPSTDEPTTSVWSICNSMVISWLLNTISKDIADSLLYLDIVHVV